MKKKVSTSEERRDIERTDQEVLDRRLYVRPTSQAKRIGTMLAVLVALAIIATMVFLNK